MYHFDSVLALLRPHIIRSQKGFTTNKTLLNLQKSEVNLHNGNKMYLRSLKK